MMYFVGLDVSVKETSVCVVDEAGQVVSEHRTVTEPDAIAVLLTSLGGEYGRVGLEAGPLSQWLVIVHIRRVRHLLGRTDTTRLTANQSPAIPSLANVATAALQSAERRAGSAVA